MSYPVFVYGTLKRNHINHVLLEGVGVERIRRGRFLGAALYDIADPMRPYPYPALLRGAGQVLGELVDLTQLEDGLLVLDHLECEGFEYHRVACWVRVAGQRERAWVYVYASKRFLCRMKGTRHGSVSWSPQRRHLAKRQKTV
jgi:gamma-glutamylcyclotransferase (GGCT)/AIG2-like uncharacterized protein YtfP